MPPEASRPFLAHARPARPSAAGTSTGRGKWLTGLLAVVVTALCAVAWAGIRALDAGWAVTRVEGAYVNAWGLAFGHLDGFVRSTALDEYAKFESDLDVPLAVHEARRALRTGDLERAAAAFRRAGVAPDDVRDLLRLHLAWARTPTGVRYLDVAGDADREMLAFRDLGRRLRDSAVSGPLTPAQTAAALTELARAERALNDHSGRLRHAVVHAADDIRRLVLLSVFAAGALLLALAGLAATRLLRRVERSEEWFRTLYEASPDAVLAYRITEAGPGRFVAVNQTALDRYGYSREELLAMTPRDLHSPGGEGTGRHRTRDGREFPVEVREVVCDVHGERLVFCTARDVSERAAAERAVRESEARYRQIAEHLDIAVWMADAQTWRSLYVSPVAERVWGLPLDTFLGEPERWLHRVHEADREAVHRFCDGPFDERAEVTFRLSGEGEAGRHLRIVAFPIRGADGALHRIAGFTADVTEAVRLAGERAALARAEDALRVKTALLRGVSEELRTPLTAIVGFADLLHEEVPVGDARDYAAIIGRNARRLEESVTGLLEMAQIESGAVPVRPRALDVVAAAEGVVEELRPLADAKGIEVAFTTTLRRIEGHVDQEGLRRVLRTLVSYGLRYTDSGGVHVHVGATAAEVVLRVRDTGLGVGPETLAALLDGLDGVVVSPGGLPLALVRRLVETMGGAIDVSSTPGLGTTFAVRFPRVPPPAAPAVPGGGTWFVRATPAYEADGRIG